MRACCVDCGAAFHREADEDWKLRCTPCFKKFKRAESAVEDSYWKNRALSAESRAAVLELQLTAQTQKQVGSFDYELAEHWRSLVQLCHPDKHGGSQGATLITQWLLDIKDKLLCV